MAIRTTLQGVLQGVSKNSSKTLRNSDYLHASYRINLTALSATKMCMGVGNENYVTLLLHKTHVFLRIINSKQSVLSNYTARNITDLLQVVDFTGLLQVVNKLSASLVDFIKLKQICENQTCCNLIFADLLQVVEITCIKLVDETS